MLYNQSFKNVYNVCNVFTSSITLPNAGNLGIGITNPFATLAYGTPIIAADISNP
jgi:hypothetical protein